MGWISARSLVMFGMATLLIYGTSASVAQAKGAHPLVQSDFYNAVNVSIGSDSSSNLRLEFGESDARISFDTSRFSGYNAVTFDVDNSNGPADAGNGIRVLGDGKTLATIDFGNPATARRQTVRFAGHRVITFVRHSTDSSGAYYVSAPTLVVSGASPAPITVPANAKGHSLAQSDFYNAVNVSIGSDSSSNLRLEFGESDARISFDTSRFSGYNTVTFDVDNSNGPANPGDGIQVLGDGKVLLTVDFGNPATARRQTVRFAGHRVITFVRHSTDSSGAYYVSAPTLVTSGAAPVPPPTIVLASTTVHGGAQQTVDVSTTPGRPVTIVIVYANGEHQVFGPQQAGPTGHDIYTFSVLHGSKGTAEVVVIVRGLSVAQTTFAVS